MNDKERLYPVISGAFEEISTAARKRAKEIFGDTLPEEASERIEWELSALSDPESATIFLICKKLVDKSHEDGYPVGTRGTLGASLVAYLLGITGINPLKDGFDIPAETLFGYDGKKALDINFNFASSYKWKAIDYLCGLFGEGRIVLEKRSEFNAEPYGVIILPEDADIEKYTALRAYENNGRIYRMAVTPFYEIDAGLLKINILSHDAPEMLKKLSDETGKSESDIPIDDERVMSHFTSKSELEISVDEMPEISTGTLWLPEFGSEREREMLMLLHPENIEDLPAISALSHGTGCYEGNAKELIESGTARLKEVISYRDHIMQTLMDNGISRESAYSIMETVRKGKVLRGKAGNWGEAVNLMKEHSIPDWYIDSMERIGYLFPKAHCVAYALLSWKLAWYKAYYPKSFSKVCSEVSPSWLQKTDAVSG